MTNPTFSCADYKKLFYIVGHEWVHKATHLINNEDLKSN